MNASTYVPNLVAYALVAATSLSIEAKLSASLRLRAPRLSCSRREGAEALCLIHLSSTNKILFREGLTRQLQHFIRSALKQQTACSALDT